MASQKVKQLQAENEALREIVALANAILRKAKDIKEESNV